MEIWSTEVSSQFAHFCGPGMDQLLWTNFDGLTSVDQLLWTNYGPAHLVHEYRGFRKSEYQYLTGTLDSNMCPLVTPSSYVNVWILHPQSQNIHFHLIGVICRLVIWFWNIRHLLCITVFLIILWAVLWKRHNCEKWLILWQCLQCSKICCYISTLQYCNGSVNWLCDSALHVFSKICCYIAISQCIGKFIMLQCLKCFL